MKSLNENQKKWGLTAVLLAVLGFNLSAPLKQQMQVLDLASKDLPSTEDPACDMTNGKEEVVIGSKGERHKVHYFKCGDHEALAFYPVKFEGKSCSSGTCIEKKILNADFKNAQDLEAALRQSLASSVTPTADVPHPDERDSKVDAREQRVTAASEALDKIADRCNRKHKEDSSLASCLNREFLNVLKRKKDLDVGDANSWFDGNIKPVLKRMLRNYSDGNSDYQDVASMIKDLESDLPKEYKRIRDSLKDLIKEGVQEYANKLRRDRIEAVTSKATADIYEKEANRLSRSDPSSALMYQQMAMQQRAQAMQLEQRNLVEKNFLTGSLTTTLFNETQIGLLSGVSSNLIDQSYMNSTLNAIRTNSLASIVFGNSPIQRNEIMVLPINGTSLGLNSGLGSNGLGLDLGNTLGGQQTVIQVRAPRGGTMTIPAGRQYNRSLAP